MRETLKVDGITCSCCVGKVEKSINQLEGVSSIEIDVDKRVVKVNFNEGIVTLGQIIEKIEREGYKVV